MASKPPARPSKRPSKAPASPSEPPKKKTAAPPPRRQTTEVQMSWLESADEDLSEPAGPARVRPPRLPGASRTLPPMPVTTTPTKRPPRRATMEVDMKWVEVVDDPPPPKKSEAPKPARKILPKALKREEE